MSFLSVLRISIHNLFQNKVRTALTVTVLTVISFVVVMLMGIAYSLQQSIDKNMNWMISTLDTSVTVTKHTKKPSNNAYPKFTPEDIDTLVSVMSLEKGYITYITLNSQSSAVSIENSNNTSRITAAAFYPSSNRFTGKGDYLIAGRMWDTADKSTNNVWLSSDYKEQYQPGDKITCVMSDSSRIKADFTVAGLLNETYTGKTTIYFSYDVISVYAPGVLSSITAVMVPQKNQTYSSAAVTYFSETVRNIKAASESVIGPSEDDVSLYVNCQLVDTLDATVLIMLMINGAMMFISVIIVLMSIGSVANTVKITTEQNQKFYGMMKAIGMKNRTLRSIVNSQIVIMTFFSVALASLLVFLFSGAFRGIIVFLVQALFYGFANIIVYSISVYIPIAVAVVLCAFVLLFTSSSLREISRMDVISVINEVK